MSLFFHPSHKAQKDRAILKRVDYTLSRQGLPSSLLHFVIFIVIEFHLMDVANTPTGVYVAGLAMVVMAATRFIMIAQFESWYAKGPSKWRDLFILSGFIHSAIWSCYLAYRWSLAPDEPIMWVGLLYTMAIAAGGSFIYSLYGQTVRIFLFILLLPLVTHFFLQARYSTDFILGLGLVAVYFYFVNMASRISSLVWGFLAKNHEYKLRLGALEQAREANTVETSSNRRFIQQVLSRLKNPLSGLIGVLGMLSVNEKDTQNDGMLNIARRSGYSILDLMTDLEAFVEQRDQTQVPQSMVFNLRKTLEHAMADMGAKAHENGRELSYFYHSDVPERIEADPQMLANAFRRLLDFTVDMADSGEITVRVAMAIQQGRECLQMSFYFVNSEIDVNDLTAALDRQMDILPENGDVADQLTLMVGAGQFKRLGANLAASGKNDLNKISVLLPIDTTTQQATAFKPAKYMAGKSITLVDLSPQTERSLTAEFMSWNMNVAVWTVDRLCEPGQTLETDFLFINVPVDDQKAKAQLDKIQSMMRRLGYAAHVILYASELQKTLFSSVNVPYTFVEKPVARDQLLSALRDAAESRCAEQQAVFRCEKTRLLIAEDNLLNQKVIISLLEPTGVMFDTCTNGEEALGLIDDHDYDMVLMDCHMPRLNGLEATRQVRQKEADVDSHVPIIAMTSEQTPELERACLEAGMDDFLLKPLNYETLIASIQRWRRDVDTPEIEIE